MGKNVQRALRKAALGGSIGPVPKSHKITGEFRDPSERPHGQPWLRPWYMSPRKAEEAAGTRREDTRPPIVPRVHSIAGMADGGPVAGDELGSDPIELERLRLAARGTAGGQPLDEATLARNAQITRDALLDVTPVIGNYRSGRRAIEAGRKLGAAEDVPSRRRAMGEVLLEGIGALSPLPWGRTAGRAAAGGADAARIFAGPLAKTADHAALRRAEEMRWSGASRDDIWRETGWAMDEPRGQWYFEIPDNKAYYDTDALKEYAETGRDLAKQPATMGEVFGHKELYRAYPDIEDMPLRFVPSKEMGGARGSYRRDLDAITMASDNTPEKMLSYGLHEMQHPVQKREAFAPGASARRYMQERGISEADADKLYRRTAGEVQARNVQARANMTPEERRAIPPWKTQDIDESDVYYPPSIHETQDVLIPALDGPATKLAREMRDAGQPMDRIWRETQRTPGPEGVMRREIRDTEMTVNPSLRVGDEWALSDAIRHPALFAVRPDLATRTLKVIDATDRAGRPVVRTDMAGNFELNPAAGDLRAQLAKLLQYEIQKEGGLAQPLRHGVTAFERGIDRARTQADDLDVDASGRAAIDAYLDDLAGVDANYQLRKALDMHGSKTGMSNAAAEMGAYNAGNMEARAVAGRALGKPGDLKQWPYQRVAPYLGRAKLPSFGQTYSLPPDDLTDSQMLEFIQRWGQFGSGRGKFARGGRVKRKALAKAAKLTLGGVRGKTGGRADKLPVDVPAGAYVIPADVVAALGDGNTEAGMARLDRQFPAARGYAAGGRAEPVPIQISDGEFVVSPAAVAALGGGDEGYGHEVLDEFVTQTRAAYADHLQNLPGPQR